VSIMDMPGLVADHDDPRILHSLWCREHVNCDPVGSPEYGLCTAPFEVEFPGSAGPESVRSSRVDLSFSAVDLASHHEPTYGFLAINGGSELQIEAWKLAPIGYAMLAAAAQARGESEAAQAFMATARDAIAEHAAEADTEAAAYVVADVEAPPVPVPGKPATARYQVALVGLDQYEIHTLKPVYIGKSVDGVTYTDHATAKAAADRLEAARPREPRAMEFPRPTTVTPGQARGWLCRVLTEDQVPVRAVDAAGLVVTELVTNACLYGPLDGVVKVSVQKTADGIEITVWDAGTIPPEQWQPREGDEHGRGLLLVHAMAARVETAMHPYGGKTVTALIATD
jgi:anti-sigma regulatory factor (Ser/Thr protein kinase)